MQGRVEAGSELTHWIFHSKTVVVAVCVVVLRALCGL